MSDGRAKITFEGDATSAKAASAQAEDSIKKVKTEGDKTGATDPFDSATKGGEKFLGGMTKILGLAGKIVLIFAAAKTAAELAFDAMSSGADKAKDALDKMDFSDMKNVKGNIKAVQAEISKLEGQLSSGYIGRAIGGTFTLGKTIEDQLRVLRKTRDDLQKQDNTQKITEDRKVAKDQRRNFEEERDALIKDIAAKRLELSQVQGQAPKDPKFDVGLQLRELNRKLQTLDQEQRDALNKVHHEKEREEIRKTFAERAELTKTQFVLETQLFIKMLNDHARLRIEKEKQIQEELRKLREDQFGDVSKAIDDVVGFGRGGTIKVVSSGGGR